VKIDRNTTYSSLASSAPAFAGHDGFHGIRFAVRWIAPRRLLHRIRDAAACEQCSCLKSEGGRTLISVVQNRRRS
jgi:hypothetical protein